VSNYLFLFLAAWGASGLVFGLELLVASELELALTVEVVGVVGRVLTHATPALGWVFRAEGSFMTLAKGITGSYSVIYDIKYE
jgi:hypothetical protein